MNSVSHLQARFIQSWTKIQIKHQQLGKYPYRDFLLSIERTGTISRFPSKVYSRASI
jgi:hypothetical protein